MAQILLTELLSGSEGLPGVLPLAQADLRLSIGQVAVTHQGQAGHLRVRMEEHIC